MQWRRWWMVIPVVAMCAGCLDSGGNSDGVTAPALLTGTWNGATSAGEPVTLVLDQALVDVTGTAEIGALSGAITGTVDGNRFEATIQSDPIRQLFSSAQGDVLSGTVRDVRADIVSSFEARRE